MKHRQLQDQQKSFLMQTLEEQCDPRHPLRKLGATLPWKEMEAMFASRYSNTGRPAKPIRLMISLLLLKQMHDLSDQAVVQRWVENPYWQHFSGMEHFQWELPCDPSDLVYFRHRIGPEGVEQLLGISAKLHGEAAQEPQLVIDSTVQEKNITHPVDSKQYGKIIQHCWKLADDHGIKLRRSYGKELKQCVRMQRFHRDKQQRQKADKGVRRMQTIAGTLVRELTRKLPAQVAHELEPRFALYQRVLQQKRSDGDKIYSLHEPHVYCVAKGKTTKKYEFGTKASLAMTKTGGIIVAAVAHATNQYDGHTLPEVLAKAQLVQQKVPKAVIVDRGYRGQKWVGRTEVLAPGPRAKGQSKRRTQQLRQCFRRRAAIEPVISHLKADYRMSRCLLKGFAGDQINLAMAAVAWNLNKWLRLFWLFWLFWLRLCQSITLLPKPAAACGNSISLFQH